MLNIIQTIPELFMATINTVLNTLKHNWLVLVFTITVAVLFKTYINTDKFSKLLLKKGKVSIWASVAVGAFTPFCACGTTALIIGMLSTTLPWAPIMAFLTSSPMMSPEGFIMISGILSPRFAIALTIASLIIGILSGYITSNIEKKTNFLKNQTRYSNNEQEISSCSTCNSNSIEETQKSPQSFFEKYKISTLAKTFWTLGIRQILLYFSIFVAIGYLINCFVPASIINVLFGQDNWAAVPLASIIGLPLYVTTESAIPLIQSMLNSGASEGAMLSFIITGSATSAWVIAGLSTFLKKRAIALYVSFIFIGGILFGYLYDLAIFVFNLA